MFKTLKVRLYPTEKQKVILENHFNACRFVYNLTLEYKSFIWKHYKVSITAYSIQKEFRSIRNETMWLKEIKSDFLRKAIVNADNSFKNFYRGRGYPKFKSKNGTQSFDVSRQIFINNSSISFSNKEYIKFKSSESYLELLSYTSIKYATFNKDLSGNYWASCLIEILSDKKNLPDCENIVGIDLGLKDLLVTSDGVRYENNRYSQLTHCKIAKLQRKFSRSKKNSKNRNKLRIRIAKLHQKIYNQRDFYYHQVTNKLISDNQAIIMETLKIKNMVKNSRLSRSISDVSWGLLTRQLQYKSSWYTNRSLIRISSFYPSTKTCSSCGAVKEMPLSERIYNCECGLSLDRDINAAINIRNMGLKIPFKPAEISGYAIDETGSN